MTHIETSRDYWREIYTAPENWADPDKHVITTYLVEPRPGITLLDAGIDLAAESTIGTWTRVKTGEPRHLAGRIFKLEHRNGYGIVHIATPLELFDLESGIPNLLSVAAGNVFGLSSVENVRLLDIHLPKSYVQMFKGPKFGIEGIRKIVGTLESRRPHLGTIVKPKVGLNPREFAKVAYEAAMGGVDLVKDDETLVNQRFCPLLDRLTHVMEMLDKVREETGKHVLYALNVTADYPKILEYADKAIENGANCLMVDVICAGFSALKAIAEDPSVNVPIHVHRAMHAAFTRNPRHGIHMMVIAKLVRLAGGDQLHTGTAAGKMEKTTSVSELRRIDDWLREPWYGLKNVMPVASGGIHPALVPRNIEALGRDILINAGGGIHGHPDGTRAGAKAMMAAIEAVMQGVPLEEYAKSSPELKRALEYWGKRFLD